MTVDKLGWCSVSVYDRMTLFLASMTIPAARQAIRRGVTQVNNKLQRHLAH